MDGFFNRFTVGAGLFQYIGYRAFYIQGRQYEQFTGDELVIALLCQLVSYRQNLDSVVGKSDLPGRTGNHGVEIRNCVLELVDPMTTNTITVAGRRVPLETDLSTPLGYSLEKGREKKTLQVETWGLLDPGGAEEMLVAGDSFDYVQDAIIVEALLEKVVLWAEAKRLEARKKSSEKADREAGTPLKQ